MEPMSKKKFDLRTSDGGDPTFVCPLVARLDGFAVDELSFGERVEHMHPGVVLVILRSEYCVIVGHDGYKDNVGRGKGDIE